MNIDSEQLEQRAKRDWTAIAAWIGGISLVLGFVATITGSFAKIEDHFRSHAERDSKMAVALSESKQGDYAAALASYGEVLKVDPLYAPALDQQLQSTMLWVEDFRAYMKEGQDDPGPVVGAQLDQIIAILDGGLVRVHGPAAADVQAHLGWAHWLNQHVAGREFGPATEKNLRGALAVDSGNVYANAMLGNWLLQNGGSFDEAVAHFHTAVSTGKVRPLVRTMQIGGLLSDQSPRSSVELIRAANDMRKNGEPLDAENKGRILFVCFGSSMDDRKLVVNSLSSLPPDDAYQTYLWLDDQPREGDDMEHHAQIHDFVQANVFEIAGRRSEALAKYRTLQQELKNQHSTLQDPVNDAIARLSHTP